MFFRFITAFDEEISLLKLYLHGTLCELKKLHFFKCSLVRYQLFWNWRWFSAFCWFFKFSC